MKNILMCLSALLISLTVVGQEVVTGKVTDAVNNNPLSGAVVKTTKGTTVTDKNGVFSVTCSDSIQLTVSCLSYETYTHYIKNCKEELAIKLTPSNTNLNEVEITATSEANKSLLYKPISIAKLSEIELKRGTGLFLDDAINANIPGVYMERRTVAAGQQFNIRGYGNGARGTNGINSNFDGQGSKVYLNNIALTDAEGITLMDDIDFGSIAGVEIVKGPAGSLYGLAIAGVVNLKTLRPEKDKVSLAQDVMIGSYGLNRFTTHLQIGGEHASLLVNYGKQKSDGFMSHSASNKDFVNLFGAFVPNEKQTVDVYFGYSNSYDQRGGELTIDQYKNFDYTGNPSYIKNNAHSEIMSYRTGLSHSCSFNKTVSNTTSVFGSGVSNNASSAGGWTDKNPVNVGLRSTLDLKWTLSPGYQLGGIVGVEIQRQYAQLTAYAMVVDSTNITGYNIIGPMRSNQSSISGTTSLFTEWTLSLPSDFSLTAGIGSSTMSIALTDKFYVAGNNKPASKIPTKYDVSYSNMISPHIAINKVFNKRLSVYAAYSKGYKAPVSSYIFIPTTGAVNTSLKAEVGDQFEIGTKGALLENKLTYQIALFDAVFSNKMTSVAVPLNATTTAYTYVTNGGKQDNKGIEVLARYTAYQSTTAFLRAIHPFANFCYSDFKYVNFKYQSLDAKKQVVEVDYSGKAVAGVPPITVNAGVDLLLNYGIYANVNYSYRDGMPFTSDGLNKTSSYNLLNAKLGIQQNFLTRFSLDVFFGINNITGTQYYYMVFLNQLPDAYLPAPYKANYFGGINLKCYF